MPTRIRRIVSYLKVWLYALVSRRKLSVWITEANDEGPLCQMSYALGIRTPSIRELSHVQRVAPRNTYEFRLYCAVRVAENLCRKHHVPPMPTFIWAGAKSGKAEVLIIGGK